MTILLSTTHRVCCYDWSCGSGGITRWKALREDTRTSTSAYNHISPGASQVCIQRTASVKQPTILSPQLVHRFFQKYEPRSPGICAFLLLIVPVVGSGAFAEGPSSVLGRLFRTYAIFYTALISSVVFYRLSPFHPLARYPGPVQAKISKLWFVSTHGNAFGRSGLILHLFKARLGWQGKQHVHYMNLHKKYGDVVRVGMPNFKPPRGFELI